jgi:alkanesulfonate monooxygenase SsuD/methylene tetrahydromethanopterin reductase-like flavin-dependent oxidoreductase (luciferase family)
MEFGVFDHLDRYDLPLDQYYEARLTLIQAYEASGFYAYHVAEHHSTPLGMAPSPSVFLSAVAQRTRRLRFGPMVYALPLYHPLRMIEELCMLDQLSRGRLDMGFGRGSAPIELEFYGQKAETSQDIYAEALELIIQGLTEKVLNFHGKNFHFDNVPMELSPYQKPYPPIWYGVHAPDSAERAARKGLQIISLDPVAATCASFDRFRATWRASHGDAKLPMTGLGRFVVVAETDAAALAIARRAYLKWHDSFTYLFRRHNRPQSHPRPTDFDRLIAVGQGIAGAPSTVAAFLRSQLQETGSNYMVGQFAFGDISLPESLHSLELFTREVMPELKD